jgi:hypothetical protein
MISLYLKLFDHSCSAIAFGSRALPTSRDVDFMSIDAPQSLITPPHPRVLGWFGTTALAMGAAIR